MTFSIIDFFLIIRRLWKEFKTSVAAPALLSTGGIRRLSTQMYFPKSVCARARAHAVEGFARSNFDSWAPNTAKYAVPAIHVMRCYLRRKDEFVFVTEKSVPTLRRNYLCFA